MIEINTKPIKAKFEYLDLGICVEHNYLCAVCKENSAVLNMDGYILQPCWDCQKKDYKLLKLNWLGKFLIKYLGVL